MDSVISNSSREKLIMSDAARVLRTTYVDQRKPIITATMKRRALKKKPKLAGKRRALRAVRASDEGET